MLKYVIAGIGLLALFSVGEVFAQSPVSVVVTEPSFTQTLWANVQGPLTALLSATLITVAGWLAVKVNTFFNVTNKAQQQQNEVIIRNILHDAVWSAVKFASQKAGVTIDELASPGLPPKQFVDSAVEYVRSKNPDAAAGVSDADLREIIVSKVPDLVAQQQPAAPAAVVVAAPPPEAGKPKLVG